MGISKCCSSKINKDYLGNKRCSFCLLPAKSTNNFKIIYAVILIAFFISYSVAGNKEHFNKYTHQTNSKDSCVDIELSDSAILHQLELDSCEFPIVALKQYHKETAFGKSPILLENNNLFGLKCYCKLCIGFKNNHSVYKTRKDCILCYTHFMNSYWKKYCNIYAEDKNYLKDLAKTK
jgi:hypothetical protein